MSWIKPGMASYFTHSRGEEAKGVVVGLFKRGKYLSIPYHGDGKVVAHDSADLHRIRFVPPSPPSMCRSVAHGILMAKASQLSIVTFVCFSAGCSAPTVGLVDRS